MTSYTVTRKHSADTGSSDMDTFATKAEAREYIAQELQELLKHFPDGTVIKTTSGGIEVYHFDANNPTIITYGFVS